MFNAILHQIPQDLPNQSTPIDFTNPVELVLYIIIPLLMISAYLYWRRNNKR